MRRKKTPAKGAAGRRENTDEVIRQPTGHRVYALLREQILSLELLPNSELDEVQISREFGFSRTPIREALIRLASDGLVTLAPNRAARVAALDLDQVPQVLEALELYERATTRWATQRRREADIELLEKRNREFAQAARSRDHRLIVETNWAFHDAINQACGNRFMAHDCSKLLRGVMRLSLLAFRQDQIEVAGYAIKQHEQMIDAIRNGDTERAEQLVFEHSDEFRERMKSFVAGSSTSSLLLSERRR